jgi:hypothetical protein
MVYKRYISCEIKISCLLIRKYFVISQKTFLIYRAQFFIYRVYKLYTGYIRVYKLGI